ncbi:MAG: ribosomal protein S18-alanine N-acetyltransferase [Cellvibrionales bacterium]|nr:ribosomal protein S18-alanine N-acetyltransferase [Cellvibrionales bacterium]
MDLIEAPIDELIRPMARDDIPSIAEIEQSEGYSAWSKPLIDQSFRDHQGWVSITNGRLVAYAFFSRVLDELTLLNIVTNKPFRQQGVAERLLTKIFSIYRTQGAKRCFLEVGETNLSAQTLYKKLGFIIVGRRKAYYKSQSLNDSPEDALVLQVDL